MRNAEKYMAMFLDDRGLKIINFQTLNGDIIETFENENQFENYIQKNGYELTQEDFPNRMASRSFATILRRQEYVLSKKPSLV